MVRFEELVKDAVVTGLETGEAVTLTASNRIADNALEVFWRNSAGILKDRLLYEDSLQELAILQRTPGFSFTADSEQLRLVSEAWRIKNAHIFDPYLAVHISDVEPLPHQISAVYQEMLHRLPLRYILADDPGAGKTIMAGLLIRELKARGDLARCLIVCPGSLVEQWQDELHDKFNLQFEILGRSRFETAVTGNAFEEIPLAIARLDQLARDENLQEKLKVTEWDLTICDEAHKMSVTVSGDKVMPTRRFELGSLLSAISRNFLLLTATPHNGKEPEFQKFLSLVDEDRFGGSPGSEAQKVNVTDIMRRLVKEDLLKFDGSPLFPERVAITLNYDLSKLEAELYEEVTAYVQSEFNRADKLGSKRRINIGFALTVLQRRLASSPEAIYQSLKRRRERMEKRLLEEQTGVRDERWLTLSGSFDEDELNAEETEKIENELADSATAATTIAELKVEIETLRRLEDLAYNVRKSGTDRKWEELSDLLQEEDKMFDQSGVREKLIIFTEHRDTLRYLTDKMVSLLGDGESVVNIYGGMSRDMRHKMEESFKNDGKARILVATDAAGEGINLQRSHLMVNYDLPWNPNRLEQRFGRIHRIGQTRTCWLWNLVADKTREGKVFERLFSKLEQEKAALGGKVFDILGKLSFNNRPLKELLIEAVRYKDNEAGVKIEAAIDVATEKHKLCELMREYALTDSILDKALITSIREDMERMEARRLQPYYIGSFFKEAFRTLGGRIVQREPGRYEITFVPADLRKHSFTHGKRDFVAKRYERICFDKKDKDGKIPAELVCPGHPLLEAVIAEIRKKYGRVLQEGAILIDPEDAGESCRLLFYIRSAIHDNTLTANGRPREVSVEINFVEVDEDDIAHSVKLAPYLDYRSPSAEEKEKILAYMQGRSWPGQEAHKKAMNYAVGYLVPDHKKRTDARRLELLNKIEKAVKERLTAEIRRLDFAAAELRQKEMQGIGNARLTSAMYQKRAEDLNARMEKRLEELAREKTTGAQKPEISGAALIVPQGLVNRLLPSMPGQFAADPLERKKIEAAAMQAVMAVESRLNYFPKDVSGERKGYDIESAVPEHLRNKSGDTLRFIEVKGRAKGADTVSVTANEMKTGFNSPEQFILALVEVDEGIRKVTYLKRPFTREPDFAETSSIFNLAKLEQQAEIIHEEIIYT